MTRRQQCPPMLPLVLLAEAYQTALIYSRGGMFMEVEFHAVLWKQLLTSPKCGLC